MLIYQKGGLLITVVFDFCMCMLSATRAAGILTRDRLCYAFEKKVIYIYQLVEGKMLIKVLTLWQHCVGFNKRRPYVVICNNCIDAIMFYGNFGYIYSGNMFDVVKRIIIVHCIILSCFITFHYPNDHRFRVAYEKYCYIQILIFHNCNIYRFFLVSLIDKCTA